MCTASKVDMCNFVFCQLCWHVQKHPFHIWKMFELNKNSQLDRTILKCDYIGNSPREIGTINTANSQIKINIPRKDSVISRSKSYLDLSFDELRNAHNNTYVDEANIRLVNLGPIVLISICKLTTSSWKHFDETIHAHIVSLLYKVITLSRGSDALPIGFDQDHDRCCWCKNFD